MKLTLLLASCLVVSACGGNTSTQPAQSSTQVTAHQGPQLRPEETFSDYQQVGTYQKSERNPDTGEWYVTTSQSMFRTYTSARFQPFEPLTLKTTYVVNSDRVTARALVGTFGPTVEVEVKL